VVFRNSQWSKLFQFNYYFQEQIKDRNFGDSIDFKSVIAAKPFLEDDIIWANLKKN